MVRKGMGTRERREGWTMYRTGSGVKPWLAVMILAGSATVVPQLRAQELDRDPARGGVAVESSQFGVLVGVRGEFAGLTSPGASLDLVLNAPNSPVWMSLQFLAQMTRWNVDFYDEVRRNRSYSGRVRLGLGRRQGPSVYALFERGAGTIVAPDVWQGDTYSLVAGGLGVGWTVGRVTASVEGGLGNRTRYRSERYHSLGVSLQYHLFRTDLR